MSHRTAASHLCRGFSAQKPGDGEEGIESKYRSMQFVGIKYHLIIITDSFRLRQELANTVSDRAACGAFCEFAFFAIFRVICELLTPELRSLPVISIRRW